MRRRIEAKVKLYEFEREGLDNKYIVDERDNIVYKVINTMVDGWEVICIVKRYKQLDDGDTRLTKHPVLDSIIPKGDDQ